jgi:Ca-activated chloride channel family protein
VILDISGSMRAAINDARQAVVEFMKTSNPADEFFLISFSNEPKLLRDFTEEDGSVQSELVYTIPKGQTALLDAVYLGMSKMRNAKYPRKALLIITDGGENHSRYTSGEIERMVKEADAQIYAIGIAGRDYAPGFLRAITEGTGGRALSGSDLADAAVKISSDLRNQYVIGYRSRNLVHDGKWRKIKVKLHAPKGLPPLHVVARTGYYVPSE